MPVFHNWNRIFPDSAVHIHRSSLPVPAVPPAQQEISQAPPPVSFQLRHLHSSSASAANGVKSITPSASSVLKFSTPSSPSRPSQEDIKLAFDSNASYMIISFMAENPVLNSYHIEKGQVEKEDLRIYSDEYYF